MSAPTSRHPPTSHPPWPRTPPAPKLPTLPRLLHPSTLRDALRQRLHSAELAETRQWHAHAFKNGAVLDPYVQDCLVRLYAKCRACRDSRAVLAACADPCVVSQNDLIVALCRVGDLRGAREVFDGMRARNGVSWSVMLDGYAKGGEMVHARELFDIMPERTPFVWCSMVSGYLRCRDVAAAREIFGRMGSEGAERNVVTWTAMISGCVQNGRHKEALDVFLEMLELGLKPNNVTLVSVLPTMADLGALMQGRWVHAYIERNGIEVDAYLGTALIDMYWKCDCIDEAMQVFEGLKYKGTSAWNSLIAGLAAHGRGKDALCVFARMREDPLVTPNLITFACLLTACSHSGLVTEAQEVFDLFTSYYQLTPDLQHYTCMIDLLANAGLLEEAVKLLDKMPVNPNSAIWTTLLSACRVHKKAEMAERLWRKVKELCPQDCEMLKNICDAAGQSDDGDRVIIEEHDQKITKAAGCSWMEVDGAVHEFFMGDKSSDSQNSEIFQHNME